MGGEVSGYQGEAGHLSGREREVALLRDALRCPASPW